MGSSGGSSGPTKQQQELEAQQAITNAQLNVQENQQRKQIMQSMQGMRMFRGSALTRATASDTAATSGPSSSAAAPGGPSRAQINNGYGNAGNLNLFGGGSSILDGSSSAAVNPGAITGGKGGFARGPGPVR